MCVSGSSHTKIHDPKAMNIGNVRWLWFPAHGIVPPKAFRNQHCGSAGGYVGPGPGPEFKMNGETEMDH